MHAHTHTQASALPHSSRTRVFIRIRSDFDQPYLTHTCRVSARASVCERTNRLNFRARSPLARVRARTPFEVHATLENPPITSRALAHHIIIAQAAETPLADRSSIDLKW